MKTEMTVSEAIAAGYEYYGYDLHDFQHLHMLTDIHDDDFNRGKILLADIEASYTTIDAEDIAETLAEQLEISHSDETGDDTNSVYDIVKALDFSDVAERINKALQSCSYRKLTDIKLIPDTKPNN